MRRIALVCTSLIVGCVAPQDADSVSDEVEVEVEAAVPPEYAEGKLLSDITPEIAARLRAILATGTGDADSLIKVGDSITESTSFLTCLSSTPVAGDEALEATRRAIDPNAWKRRSLSAKVGWHTNQPYAGNPSPLSQEIAAMHPRYAVVMLGTNDLYEGTQPSYERNLTKLIQLLIEQGIVPIMSTIPPIRNAQQNAVVPKMNVIVRKIAAQEQLPLMDYHLALKDLPSYGLSSDGVHPFAAGTGACDFSLSALRGGYNQRNLLVLRAVDRVVRSL